jgi:hypothetical protein
MLHKLMHPDMLGFLEHLCNIVLLLFSCIVEKHGEKVEYYAVVK